MKTDANHQEILLRTDTQFAQRQWADKDTIEKPLTEIEKLENACWNGLVKSTLPEIDSEYIFGKKLWLWQIRETRTFLELELSDYPSPKDKWHSLDPYAFLETKSAN
ncbi:MAG: hypothetical protein ACHQEM_02045 [Chitinophagales bacterium]